MATTSNLSDFETQAENAAVSPDMVRAKWSAWHNFKRVILGGGIAAILTLGVLWWITY